MNCPKCDAEFRPLNYHGIEVHRCTGCHGMWFDSPNRKKLDLLNQAQYIDDGEKEVGVSHNQKLHVKCPKCEIEMTKMIDKDQFHIQYEYCTSCFGSFYDAGEVNDLKERTIIERFKQLLGTVKTNISK